MSDGFPFRPPTPKTKRISILVVCFALASIVLTFARARIGDINSVSNAEIRPPLIAGYLSEGRITRETIKSLDQNGTAKRLTHILFWSFDDARSLAAKMDYVKQHTLRGVMFWELTGDDENGSLVNALYQSSRR